MKNNTIKLILKKELVESGFYTLIRHEEIGEIYDKVVRRTARCLVCGKPVLSVNGKTESAFVDSTTSNGGKNGHKKCFAELPYFFGFFDGAEKPKGEANNVDDFMVIVLNASPIVQLYCGKNGFMFSTIRGKAVEYYGIEGKCHILSDGTAQSASPLVKELFTKNADCEIFVKVDGKKAVKVNDFQQYRDAVNMRVQQTLTEEK